MKRKQKEDDVRKHVVARITERQQLEIDKTLKTKTCYFAELQSSLSL